MDMTSYKTTTQIGRNAKHGVLLVLLLTGTAFAVSELLSLSPPLTEDAKTIAAVALSCGLVGAVNATVLRKFSLSSTLLAGAGALLSSIDYWVNVFNAP
jgi:hypothetical protein